MDGKHASENPAFLIGPTGKITTWNAACHAALGYTELEVLHQPLHTLLKSNDQDPLARRLQRPPQQAEELDLELWHADGHPLPSRLALLPQFGKSGRLISCIALIIPGRQPIQVDTAKEVGNMPLKSAMDLIVGLLIVSDAKGQFVLWNEKAETSMQMSSEQLRNSSISSLFSEQEWQRVAASVDDVLAHGKRMCIEAQLRSGDGCETPYVISGARLTYCGRHYLCIMALDGTERRRERHDLQVRERALHAVSNGIVICRSGGKDNPIEYVNPAFERITGYTLTEVVGRDSRFMAASGLDDAERQKLRIAVEAREEINVVFRNMRKNGEVFWNDLSITPVPDENGKVSHFIGMINDVTALKQRTAHLEHEVNHDALTGLANRNLLWDRLDQALHVAQRKKSLVATILLDLNKFKFINDTMGHDVGDEVLRVVAKRLQASVRDSDTVARLSGDEFVLVLADQPSLRFTLRMVERVRISLSKPIIYEDQEIPVGAALGVSVFPHDGANAYELMRAADVAMYHSKESGNGDVHFFSPDMKSTTDAKRALETDMHEALDKNELFLMYQPRMNLTTSRITGIEALLRWRHPERGVLQPSSFLPDAEENGMIIPFGQWVLEQACRMLARLKALGHPDIPLSINSSYREFSEKNYVAYIADKLDQFKLAPASLELDMREDQLMRNVNLSKQVAERVRQLGVVLNVDEFGAGSSNLSYLQELPMRHLKITRKSVNDICLSTKTGKLAKTLIDIGHNLKLEVIAGGVENRLQQDFLLQNGCDAIQGNFYKEPIDETELTQLLDAQ
ncbi:sensor domain-containing protein [Janthinobacterium agaricidamnosum]|uniref:Sensory box protein n=1 Tax=Janthinobacterium agaricidamnosum NBRC 102515 = DSM 9628 TaxID=1349767 RepID=W0V9T4_9BURK|nr:bifunctional diguanylate cyclase/phosphodiesterase [Janthinobacterium agaricidamnosum]CDG84108.1 sensory box protein [Janthinobacterium agaricidamnosum NBRC 102515 = DSM 9628]